MSTLSLYNYRSRVNVQYVEIRVIYQGVLTTKPLRKEGISICLSKSKCNEGSDLH